MKRLTFVHPESVLNTYLKQSRIKNRDGDENYIYPFRFNLSQKEALENAMKSSISIIEGPPGTGKTQTILNIIANLIIRGKSIAVVSNNNDAVKNIIDKLEKENYGFLPAMLGKKCNKENFFDNMPEAEVSGWDYEENTDDLKREIKDINKNLNNLLKTERRRAKLKQEISDWKLEQSHFEEYYGVQDINYDQKFPMFMSDPDRIIDFMAEMSLADEYEIYGKLLYKIKLFQI
ncbi:MAG: AAA domain-containing protein [Anaerovoracaceae bacterium]